MKDEIENRAAVAQGILNEQYPRYLYKFRTLESAVRDLRIPSIYMNSIVNFNDPYEGHFVLDSKNTTVEWETFLQNIGYKSSNIKKKAVYYAANPDKAQKLLEPIIRDNLEKSGVFCFSKGYDKIPMWAYYAEDHKGICIEYDPLQDEQLCDSLLPMNYSKDYVRFNYINEPFGVTRSITQKADCWAGEDEFRLIKVGEARKLLTINPQAITSVILGCKFADSVTKDPKRKELTKELLQLLLNPKYSHVILEVCQQNKNDYLLQKHAVDISFLQALVTI